MSGHATGSQTQVGDIIAQPTSREALISQDQLERNGGLQEFSVVYTDRALNHMSGPFCSVMQDLSASLKAAYKADHCVLIPGSGTFGMEAVARQFASGKAKVLVVRNGYFSFRWSQIFDAMSNDNVTVLKARPTGDGEPSSYAPPPIEEVCDMIRSERPALVCAPHVETSLGLILPPDYVKAVADAARSVDAIFCLDGIASGNAWVDMASLGLDVYLTAPQKGWTGPACAGIVMLSDRAKSVMESGPPSSSFACNLQAWHNIMQTYLSGGFAYHTTMPTDALRTFRDVMKETEEFGLERCHEACWKLGTGVRTALALRGFKSVAASGFEAPGVVVVHATDLTFVGSFKAAGLQIAAGVPFKLDEPADTKTFRLGLFGLDKMMNVDAVLATFEDALDRVMASRL